MIRKEIIDLFRVPARKKVRLKAVVSDVVTTTVHSLGLRFPAVTAEQRRRLAEAKAHLEAE